MIAVRKDIPNNIIVENRTDLLSHPYCIYLDIKEIDGQTERCLRKTRVINLYDNKIGRGQLWEGSSPTPRRAIQDICWRSIIRGRVLIVGDMNAHSPIWNPHCHQRQNAGPLEELIETYELLVNNNTDFPTRPGSRGILVTLAWLFKSSVTLFSNHSTSLSRSSLVLNGVRQLCPLQNFSHSSFVARLKFSCSSRF